MFETKDILETISMIREEKLDIRTITMGISLYDCQCDDPKRLAVRIYDRVMSRARDLVRTGEEIEKKYGIPIINKRVSVTPVALMAGGLDVDGAVGIAKTLDRAAHELGINFIGGYSALVQKGFTNGSRTLISSIPQALAETERVCSSVNVASTKAGINMDAVAEMGQIVRDIDTIVNVTIAYPQNRVKPFIALLKGDMHEVYFHVETIPVTQELSGDYVKDKQFKHFFTMWLRDIWQKKDERLATEVYAHESVGLAGPTVSDITPEETPAPHAHEPEGAPTADPAENKSR